MAKKDNAVTKKESQADEVAPRSYLWRWRPNNYSQWKFHPDFMTEAEAKTHFRLLSTSFVKLTPDDLLNGVTK